MSEKNSVFKDRNCLLLFSGQLTSQICEKLAYIGLIWIITNDFDAKWVPWFIAVGGLPHLLMTPFSGKLVNKLGALPTVIWTDFFRGFLFLAAAYALANGVSDVLIVLFVVTFLSNFAGSLFNPAIMTLPIKLVGDEKLQKLNALIDSSFSAGNVLGPVLAVFCYKLYGLQGLMLINGLSFLASSGIELFIKPTKDVETAQETEKKPSFFSVLGSHPVVMWMLLSFFVLNLFLGPIVMFLPFYVQKVYLGNIDGLAWLEALFGIGTILGGVLLSVRVLPWKTWVNIVGSVLFCALAYFAFAVGGDLLVGCISVAFVGLFVSVANVVIIQFFQTTPSQDEVPIVMSLVNLITVATYPISMGIIGAIINHVELRTLAVTCASVTIFLAAVIVFIPGIRRI